MKVVFIKVNATDGFELRINVDKIQSYHAVTLRNGKVGTYMYCAGDNGGLYLTESVEEIDELIFNYSADMILRELKD